MGAADDIFDAFRRAIGKSADMTPEERAKMLEALQRELEQAGPPVLAIIGEAGVGKSSTLNALFNAGAEVGHSSATTRTDNPYDVVVEDHEGRRGNIRVLDLPGLGESIEAAERLAEIYAQSLRQADAILWVHVASDRMLEFTERKIRELFGGPLRDFSDRLVFGLNRADSMHPGDWKLHGNAPSNEQIENLERAEENFSRIVSQSLPSSSPLRVTTYSATKRYNLARLFRMMMEAVPKDRRWILESRMDIANFLELADQRFVNDLRSRGIDVNLAETPSRADLLEMMSDAELREVTLNRLTPEEWWRQSRGR